MYCTVRDVKNVLAPFGTNVNQTAASLSDWQIRDNILEAQQTVDMFVATRYNVTLTLVDQSDEDSDEDLVEVANAPIQTITRDIAAYLTMLVWRKNQDVSDKDPIRLRYLQAIAFLTAIRDGKISLPVPPFEYAGGTVTDGGAQIYNTYEGRLFGPEDFGIGIDAAGAYARPPHGWW